MDQITWIIIGLLASGTTIATLFTEIEDILGGMIGALLWGYWAFGATNIIVTSPCCQHQYSYPALALFGAGMAALMILILLTGATTLLDPRGAALTGEEMNRR